MRLLDGWRRVVRFFASSGHRDVKSFEREVESWAVIGRADAGMRVIPTSTVVGSVGWAQNLRTDSF